MLVHAEVFHEQDVETCGVDGGSVCGYFLEVVDVAALRDVEDELGHGLVDVERDVSCFADGLAVGVVGVVFIEVCCAIAFGGEGGT